VSLNVFSRRATGLNRQAKRFDLNFLIEKNSLDHPTRLAKSSSRSVNLPGPYYETPP